MGCSSGCLPPTQPTGTRSTTASSCSPWARPSSSTPAARAAGPRPSRRSSASPARSVASSSTSARRAPLLPSAVRSVPSDNPTPESSGGLPPDRGLTDAPPPRARSDPGAFQSAAVAGERVAAYGEDGLGVAADVVREPGEDGVDGFLFGEVGRGEFERDLAQSAAGGAISSTRRRTAFASAGCRSVSAGARSRAPPPPPPVSSAMLPVVGSGSRRSSSTAWPTMVRTADHSTCPAWAAAVSRSVTRVVSSSSRPWTSRLGAS